ncbi:hypothetical protein C8R44DRAFT_52568 [Mycena epipterygia]|nr:hypothetical protein C8R44DRAFT_52568 [Mycena epipterygia]
MDYTVNSRIFNDLWSSMLFNISETCTALLLYGIYIHLFILAIHTLSRRKTAGRSPLLVASWAMLILGTTSIVLRVTHTVLIVRVVYQIIHQQTPKFVRPCASLIATEVVIFGINNFVTDTIFEEGGYFSWDADPIYARHRMHCRSRRHFILARSLRSTNTICFGYCHQCRSNGSYCWSDLVDTARDFPCWLGRQISKAVQYRRYHHTRIRRLILHLCNPPRDRFVV